MQSNLRSFLARKREVVEEPPKRGPGRPPKVRQRKEVQDAVVEAMQCMPDQPEAYDEHLRVRHRKRKYDEETGSHVEALSKAVGKDAAGMRMPGGTRGRDSTHEGPQVKLRLCNWVEKPTRTLAAPMRFMTRS